MLEEQAVRQLCQQVLQRCGAVPAEVVLLAEESALTRFANNAIHQNVAERNLTVYLRVLPGYRSGMASTNRTDPADLDGLVGRALAIAQASPEDPTRPWLAETAAYTPVACFDEATAALSPHLVGSMRKHEDVINLQSHAGFIQAAQHAPAAQQLQQVIQQQPDNLDARYQLSALHLVADQYTQAMDQLLEIIARNRNYANDVAVKGMVTLLNMVSDDEVLTRTYRQKMMDALNR